MNLKLNAFAATVLAVSVACSAYASDATSAADKSHATHQKAKKAKQAKPSVEDQVQKLREELQGQINGLKSDIAAKDAALMKAQDDAAAAQAAATRAQAEATAQQQALTENAAAVGTLNTTVNDLKANQTSLATSISDETSKIKKMVENPSTLHYKGITITPGGFAAGETVYRTHATGADIPTPFSSIPYEGADATRLSEFYGSARQSRLSLLAEGKVSWGTIRGYYEADFLGTGITSNNNQSNSYVLRQRAVYAQAETNSGWSFTAGQMWSLATEDKKGITSAPSDVMTPLSIDPNYVTGFVWTRQYGFRVAKNFKHAAFGFAAENPQVLYSATLAGDTPYAVLGGQGANGGNYNAGINSCSPSTSIVNYGNQKTTDSAGNVVTSFVPVYKTVNSCANLANISFNQAPDVIAKITFDPGFGHYEVFGIGRFAHQEVYPLETNNSNLYGGNTDVVASQIATISSGVSTTVLVAPKLSVAGAYNNSIFFGGVGASARVSLMNKKVVLGFKGLYGSGVGRYGNSSLSDLTTKETGNFGTLHNVSGLATVEINPTPRLVIYMNYGGDYVGRNADAGTTLGSPAAYFCPSSPLAFTCTKTPTQANIVAGGAWGAGWATPAAASAPVGYGSKLLNNSSCLTTSNPGYNGGSTGYYPGGSCGAQTRDVQEITGGYWYDLYKGDRGRLRQSIQYAYAVRQSWSGAPAVAGGPGIAAKGIENMVWTSFRYYLP